MGKRKRSNAEQPENRAPGLLDRIMSNTWLTIAAGAAVLVVFAAIGVLIVTLLGGDDLSANRDELRLPEPVGPPPAVERSAAADLLADKTWEEMTEAERDLVEAEAKRAFENVTFRADNDLILAIDVFRRNGKTLASRQFYAVESVEEREAGTQVIMYCPGDADGVLGHSYISTSLGTEYLAGSPGQFPQAWQPMLEGTDWDETRDLGLRKAGERTLHGFEVDYSFDPAQDSLRAQYWFDTETAQLVERTAVLEDPDAMEANLYTLTYDELEPIVLPPGLEQPDCVKDILAQLAE